MKRYVKFFAHLFGHERVIIILLYLYWCKFAYFIELKLHKYFTEHVEKVLDRCIDIPDGMKKKDPKLHLDFDMEFLDDTYSATTWGNPECVIGNHVLKKHKLKATSNYLCVL